MIEITKELGINYVFKASFDKANRTSLNGPRGVGIEEGLRTFDEIKKLYDNIPIVTDIHEREQCAVVAPHVDILQIPAFLCRQTDLLVAAAKTGTAPGNSDGISPRSPDGPDDRFHPRPVPLAAEH